MLLITACRPVPRNQRWLRARCQSRLCTHRDLTHDWFTTEEKSWSGENAARILREWARNCKEVLGTFNWNWLLWKNDLQSTFQLNIYTLLKMWKLWKFKKFEKLRKNNIRNECKKNLLMRSQKSKKLIFKSMITLVIAWRRQFSQANSCDDRKLYQPVRVGHRVLQKAFLPLKLFFLWFVLRARLSKILKTTVAYLIFININFGESTVI